MKEHMTLVVTENFIQLCKYQVMNIKHVLITKIKRAKIDHHKKSRINIKVARALL